MQFLVKDLLDEFVDLLDLPVHESLEHPETFGIVEYLESCDSPQHIH